MKNTEQRAFKMIIVGAAGVGKSSLLNKFIFGEFEDLKNRYSPTLGA
jgi:GTPase SAR1 family protein